MKRIVALIISLTFLSPALTNAGKTGDEKVNLFFEANKLYNEDRYKEAVDIYLQLIESGYNNGHLYYNLGNACFRLDQIGYVILYYERAKLLIPRDVDLDYNLRYVHQMTMDAVDENPGILSMTFFWCDSMTVGEIFLIFAIINALFWIVLILRLFFKQEWTYYLVVITLVTWLVSGCSFGWKYYQVNFINRAVVLSNVVNVLSGPNSKDTILFKLHAGTIVEQERVEDGWKLIKLPDKKRGWVNASMVELINLKNMQNKKPIYDEISTIIKK